jgi:hypothetical protein
MAEKIVVTIGTGGDTTVAAYCLKTDSWQDFLAFKIDAQQSEQEGDYRKTNRCLRAALIFLFSHLEGFVNDVEHFRNIPNIRNGSRLCDKTWNIAHEAKKYGRLPYLNFRLGKHLRDLVAHPGIEISFWGEDSKKLDSVSVFEELTLNSLKALESQISEWIDAVSAALNVPRFTDTEKLVTELRGKLWKITEGREV